MPVFQFTVNLNDTTRVSYYAKCKNLNKYISVSKCKFKTHKNDGVDIYNIIGGKYGEYTVNEIVNKSLSDKQLCADMINNDPNCINKYKLDFNRVKYAREYRQKNSDIEPEIEPKVVDEELESMTFKTLSDLGKHFDKVAEHKRLTGSIIRSMDKEWEIGEAQCWFNNKKS